MLEPTDGIRLALIQMMIHLQEFSIAEVSGSTGVAEHVCNSLLSYLARHGFIRAAENSDDGLTDTVYEIPTEQLEPLRHHADRHFAGGGPGISFRVIECLLKERWLTADLAASLTQTTSRRAGWELSRLLAENLVDCEERDGTLLVRVPEDPERLWTLIERRDFAELPGLSKNFAHVDSIWYWGAQHLLANSGQLDSWLDTALGYLERARQEAPREEWLFKMWHARIDSLEAELYFEAGSAENALECAERSFAVFVDLDLTRSAEKLKCLLDRIEHDSSESMLAEIEEALRQVQVYRNAPKQNQARYRVASRFQNRYPVTDSELTTTARDIAFASNTTTTLSDTGVRVLSGEPAFFCEGVWHKEKEAIVLRNVAFYQWLLTDAKRTRRKSKFLGVCELHHRESVWR